MRYTLPMHHQVVTNNPAVYQTVHWAPSHVAKQPFDPIERRADIKLLDNKDANSGTWWTLTWNNPAGYEWLYSHIQLCSYSSSVRFIQLGGLTSAKTLVHCWLDGFIWTELYNQQLMWGPCSGSAVVEGWSCSTASTAMTAGEMV